MVARKSTTHTAVTTFVKLQEPKITRRGPAKPHMPGLRRPHTRQTVASAFVNRPHDGQRIEPEVLRNITALVGRDAVALVEPHAEIDKAACERAEGAMRVQPPRCGGSTVRTGHGDIGALPRRRRRTPAHLRLIVRAAAKRVNSGTWRPRAHGFTLTLVETVA